MNLSNASKGTQKKKLLSSFGGLNIRENGKENEPISIQNLWHEKHPYLSTRGSKTQKSQTVTNPKALFAWDKLVYVDGTTLYYDGTAVSGSLSSSQPKQFAVVNTKLCIWPDKKYVDLTEESTGLQLRNLGASASLTSATFAFLGGEEVRMYCAGSLDDFSVGETVKFTCAATPFNNGKMGTISKIDQYSSTMCEIVFKSGTMLRPFKMYRSIQNHPLAAETDYLFTNNSYDYCEFRLAEATDSTADLYLLALQNEVMVVDEKGNILQRVEGGWFSSTETQSRTIIYSGAFQGAFTLSRDIPDLDFICSSGNRLWGVSNEVENTLYDENGNPYTYNGRCIYASALGDPKSFYQFLGISTDSYALGVASKGDFTGIVSYSDDVLCWKEHELLRMIGSEPSAFYMYQYDIPGVKKGCFKSIQSIHEVLYYVSEDGVYTYSGSIPRLISYDALDKPVTNAVAASDERKYYLAGVVNSTNRVMVYDSLLGVWTQYGDEYYKDLCWFGGEVLGLLSNKLIAFGAGSTETFSWGVSFREFTEDTLEKKEYQRIRLKMTTPKTTTVTVQVWLDDEGYTFPIPQRLGTWTHCISLPYHRADRMTIALSGSGTATIRGIQREYLVCSEDG